MIAAGTVRSLHRYPVKSMLGEELDAIELTARGVVGDRAFALVDDETGKVVSTKRPARWGRTFTMQASTVDGDVRVRLPDGTVLTATDPKLRERLSELFGRSVTVASEPPPDARFEEVTFGLDEASRDAPDGMIEGGEAMSRTSTFFNYGAVHLLTTASLARLAGLEPGHAFDVRRFRPNIVVDSEDDAIESTWPERTVTIGEVTMTVTIPVPRCVVTTVAQEELPDDRGVLRAVARHNMVPIAGDLYPCLGVYLDVVRPGAIRRGDPVLVH